MDAPVIRIVRGHVDDDELAAVVAVLMAVRLQAVAEAAPAVTRAGWDRDRPIRPAPAGSWMT
ncbi:hypothetical protein GCM10022226_40040 [Sphaerisporangium flaviroseum]|uniref:Acyl-CoA carboxylase subunit epsilon n=1 Tax=Sphaerisporangium flaviroseum TaxID=509199 RepID=A0ABP7ID28_9ACTN